MRRPIFATKRCAAGTACSATQIQQTKVIVVRHQKATLSRTAGAYSWRPRTFSRIQFPAAPPPPPTAGNWGKKVLGTIEIVTLICLRIFVDGLLILELGEFIRYKYFISHVT